ncbi:hypothetical protein [Thalassotalea marina]|uniref:Uncharacterized protein n=1 Tax=Thalassotalea marina TaxID=1673741 RepID=A0A919BSN2_9GAMM|nr:hypothetical protein [Thalassotalea marina]GHG07874.1 hypothetical protein GCM10017161_42050 [Thalassotalea marina]
MFSNYLVSVKIGTGNCINLTLSFNALAAIKLEPSSADLNNAKYPRNNNNGSNELPRVSKCLLLKNPSNGKEKRLVNEPREIIAIPIKKVTPYINPNISLLFMFKPRRFFQL